MASIKIKFRPSSVRGKEGVLFLQIIHRRVVRQIVTPPDFVIASPKNPHQRV